MSAGEALQTAFAFWAKSDSKTGRWHALPFHLVDVGATAKCLWKVLPPGSRAIAVEAFGDAEEAERIVCFLAAAHDIGKANRFFQGKVACHRERLGKYGVTGEQEFARHGAASAALLGPWLKQHWCWSSAHVKVAAAVGGHHGIFPGSTNLEKFDLRSGPFEAAAGLLLDALADLYGTPEKPAAPANLNVFLAWVAGFVSVADWLGSHASMCGWESDEGDLRKYSRFADERAAQLFEQIGWESAVEGPRLRLQELVPGEFSPNPLQELGEQIAGEGFRLAVVEAPTGEGKTECAMALAELGRSSGNGVCFLLPTMATANGMVARVERYLEKACREENPRVRLMHSMAWLHGSKAEVGESDDRELQLDGVEDWLAGSKRALLDPYGVGTVDQALIAVLRAKHGFVRLFALAGKTVVIDEVHAYDVYMSELLDLLLSWLKSLHCNVVLLSATLPRARRQALLSKWGASDVQAETAYPCIHWVDGQDRLKSRHFQARERKRLRFELVVSSGELSWQTGADLVLKCVREQGGLGCFIVNTVREAQAAYAYLRSKSVPGITVDLFHSRFTAADRAAKERHVLSRYGKEREPGVQSVLIATQVVEQSLDLDFDHMASSLAPIDLLLQRAGRLHRHARGKLGGLQAAGGCDERPDPVFYVVVPPQGADALPVIKEYVYDHSVLLRSYVFLREGYVVNGPRDVANAVDTVYSECELEPSNLALQAKLKEVRSKSLDRQKADQAKAEEVLINSASSDGFITDCANGRDEYDESQRSQVAARTRLEDLVSISLVLVSEGTEWPPTQYDYRTKRAIALNTVKATVGGDALKALTELPGMPDPLYAGAARYSKPIAFSERGEAAVNGLKLLYSATTGLEIVRNDAEF